MRVIQGALRTTAMNRSNVLSATAAGFAILPPPLRPHYAVIANVPLAGRSGGFQLSRRAETNEIVARSIAVLYRWLGIPIASLINQKVQIKCAVLARRTMFPIANSPMTTKTSVTQITKPVNGRLIRGR